MQIVLIEEFLLTSKPPAFSRSPKLECGIKEAREMLPVVIFNESFLIRETQCSVCLADYQPDERLQRIPPCGHTFHIDCIDHWLSTNTTCPLCRVSLLPAPKTASIDPMDLEAQIVEEPQEGFGDEAAQQEDQAVKLGSGARHIRVKNRRVMERHRPG